MPGQPASLDRPTGGLAGCRVELVATGKNEERRGPPATCCHASPALPADHRRTILEPVANDESRAPASRSGVPARRPRGHRGGAADTRAGHYVGTALPGQPGNVALAGHRFAGTTTCSGDHRAGTRNDAGRSSLAEHLSRFPADPEDLVFRSRTGGPIWSNTFNGSVWHPLRKRAGVPGARFHDLRHFTASALIRYGESVKTVAHVLGHADETETLRTYSHLWPDADTRTRAAVDAAFRAVMSQEEVTGRVTEQDLRGGAPSPPRRALLQQQTPQG
jgi:hypothetical protein